MQNTNLSDRGGSFYIRWRIIGKFGGANKNINGYMVRFRFTNFKMELELPGWD